MTPQNWLTVAAKSLRDTTFPRPLPPGKVHIWRASQSVEPPVLSRLHALLDSTEKARAERFVFQRDRDRFIVAHGILRELLGVYVGCAPAEIEFDRGPRGKPSLRAAGTPSRLDPADASRFDRAKKSEVSHASQTSRIRFNVSHSQGLAAFAFALDRELGVDVEQIRDNFGGEQIARHYFSPDEVTELMALPPETRAEAFFLCWTRKEAYIKARGEGLYIGLATFSVSLTPGAPERLRAEDASRWELRSFQPKEGYAGALIAEGHDLELRFFDWRP